MKDTSRGSANPRIPFKNHGVALPGVLRSTILRALTIGYIAGLILMTEQRAHAYVDPGSGLLFLQMLGASVAGGLFFLRDRLRKLFRGGTKNATTTQQAPGLTKEPDASVSVRGPDEL